MAEKHIVEAGDWIGAIAEAHGFRHWGELWEHPANEGLRALRGSPDLLMVGDEVAIPSREDRRGVAVATGQRVVFRVRSREDAVRIRVTGVGAFIAAFGPIDFVLEVGSASVAGELAEDGQIIEAPLEPAAKTAILTLLGRRKLEFAVGGIGPVQEVNGTLARLTNLGYASAKDGGKRSLGRQAGDPAATAIACFQRLQGLPVTGDLDEATRRAIVEAYGA